ncbi:MAG: hypothetical protein AAFZ18_18135 [Myxococcota bacterium]
MTSFVIRDSERGLLIRDGRTVAWLEPGRHFRWTPFSTLEVERIDMEKPVSKYRPEVARMAPTAAWTELFVELHEVGVVRVDGLAQSFLRPGRYMLWQVEREVEATVYDLRPLTPEIPESEWDLLPCDLVRKETVHPFETLLAYEDGEPARSFSFRTRSQGSRSHSDSGISGVRGRRS